MSRSVDLTGQVFGKLTVQYTIGAVKGKSMWHCVCACGKEKDVTAYDLTSGHTRSCGCMVSNNKDLTGQRFGRLVALYPTDQRKYNRVVWHCKCDCGREADYASTTLRSGLAISCGCARQDDLTGRQFDQWTVLRRAERPGYWVCQCACGTVREIKHKNLTQGYSKSCGCLRHKVKDYTGQKRGGMTAIEPTGEMINKSPEYIWRCQCGFEVKLPANTVLPSKDRLCPRCVAKKRQELARQMLEKRREGEIQSLPPGALQSIEAGTVYANNTSGVRGVYRDRRSGLWVAQGHVFGKRYYLGAYADIKDAAEGRKNFIEEWYGEAFVELKERKQQKVNEETQIGRDGTIDVSDIPDTSTH